MHKNIWFLKIIWYAREKDNYLEAPVAKRFVKEEGLNALKKTLKKIITIFWKL